MAGAATPMLLPGSQVEREIGIRMEVEDRYDKWTSTISGSDNFEFFSDMEIR
jgi:hypothetical protein